MFRLTEACKHQNNNLVYMKPTLQFLFLKPRILFLRRKSVTRNLDSQISVMLYFDSEGGKKNTMYAYTIENIK